MGAPNIIPSIFTAIDQVSGPIKRMGLSLTGLGIKAGIANERIAASMATTGMAAQKIGHTGLMLGAGIILPLGLATRAAVKFESEMTDVSTLVDTNVENMDAMGDSVLRLSKKIPKPIADLSKGLYQIRSDGIAAGNGINEAFGVLESSGKLAVAGLSTVEEAAETVTSAMNVFKDENLTSEQIANSFFKTVQSGKTKMNELNVAFGRNAGIVRAAGVTLEEFNAMTATLTMTGMKAATAQTGIAQAVTALIKPSSELEQVYEALGYKGADAFKEIVLASGGLVPAMKKIDEQGQKMGIAFSDDFREKRAMLTDIELTGTLYENYKKYLEIQKNGKDELNTGFNKQQKKGAAQIQLLENSMNRLGISIGGLVVPALSKMADVIIPIIDGIAEFGKEHKILSGIVVKGIALFGMAALAIGTVGLAVSAVTKGWALWNTALTAYNFVSGVAAVKTNLLTYDMLGNAAAAKGADWAYANMNRSLGVMALRIGVVTAGLGLIIAYHKEIASWGNDNRVGMAYNFAIGDYQEVRETLKRRYRKDPNATRKFIQDNPKYNSPTIQKDFLDIDRETKLDSITQQAQRKYEDAFLKSDSLRKDSTNQALDACLLCPMCQTIRTPTISQ
jgi:TP901 family phage tail tape measure protein